ncbi:AraC family transcriptional regulator [Mucilaginibacter sp. ZT4R22]|uniref:AraC family transcriptional regulator n=1 Tax=Mucilaginibacter pankratovii TaxID=2772110 RepID=A0ABR7WJV2_9SPHI|nr:helix-turn-helix domain-containing protein [Mucilaginibacter pankratovii]MBD1362606.1 AraC family transcriptional regulator [Mucilaginibacter pankratovii]
MEEIKTLSLSRHSRLFSVADNSKEYLFISAASHPYPEEPYRAESYALAYLSEGSIYLQAGLNSYEIEAPSLIILGPSVIRSFRKRSNQLRMDIIFFKDTFLLEQYADRLFLDKYDFFENNDLHVLAIEDAYQIKFSKIFEIIKSTQATANYHQAEIVRNYIFALIYEIDAYYRQHAVGVHSSLTGYTLFAKFKQLLHRNYMHERKLDFYAHHLHVQPKSLSAAVKKHTGKSAGKWIDETIALEAKVLLQNKSLTVSQVSNMLNFSDQSVFGKFFRANAGLSPVAYRKRFL